jgi:uncharacterized protein (TIGR02231 family)
MAVCTLSTGLLSAVALTFLSGSLAAAAAPEPQASPGQVTHVTLYREQALVTRTIPLDGPKGRQEIVVGDLPEQVVEESIFAEGSEGVEVRAVRCRNRAVGQQPREEVRKLDEALDDANQQLAVNTKSQELLTKQTRYLDQLEGFVAPTAKTDLSRGVLDAQALQKITTFSFEQRKLLADRAVTLEKEAKDLNGRIQLLQRKREELTSGASRTVREAMLFLEKRADDKGSVRLSYLAGKCGWSPAYTFRAKADRKQVQVECNGLIHQLTGEDWNGVALTLSTASPALDASRPALATFPVTLQKGREAKVSSPEELSAQLDAIRDRRNKAIHENRSAATAESKKATDWAMNVAANQFQDLELASGRNLVNTLQAGDSEQGEGPSLSYGLAGPVSVASRSDQQMVQIFQRTFESRFYYVATPVLTRHVYREAELTNASDQDLLAGPTAAYLEGRFVGRGDIPTVARGQMFVPGFGVDPQLRARRELIDRTESTQGGNRKLDFKYRLIVENYQDRVAPVRLYDRLPDCEGAPEIRVTLVEPKEPLDSDPLYLRRERPKGILRWELLVPAGAVREKAKTIEYGFSVEFDRNFQLGTLEGGKQQQSEFQQMERQMIAPAAAAPPPPALPAPPSTPAPPAP